MFDSEGENSQVNLKSFFKTDKFQKTNIIEENPIPVLQLIVPSFGIETFSFKIKN